MLSTPRYGRKIRKRYRNAQKMSKTLYECPKCSKVKLRRRSYALFVCKSCSAVVAGGAYKASTEAGSTARRMIAALKEGQ